MRNSVLTLVLPDDVVVLPIAQPDCGAIRHVASSGCLIIDTDHICSAAKSSVFHLLPGVGATDILRALERRLSLHRCSRRELPRCKRRNLINNIAANSFGAQLELKIFLRVDAAAQKDGPARAMGARPQRDRHQCLLKFTAYNRLPFAGGSVACGRP
jgi:hypothetical protein